MKALELCAHANVFSFEYRHRHHPLYSFEVDASYTG